MPAATTDRDPFALADASEDACIDRRTAHWVRDVRSVAAQRAQDADRLECDGCGALTPAADLAAVLGRPGERACSACLAGGDEPRCSHCDGEFGPGSDGDRCAACVSSAPTPEGGLREGAAALLGLCEECAEDLGADDDGICAACREAFDDEDDDGELARDRILERQELSDLDDAYPYEDDAYETDYAEAE